MAGASATGGELAMFGLGGFWGVAERAILKIPIIR